MQQQLGLMAWETGRSCQHLINRTHLALMTHKTWRELSQEKPLDTHFNSSLGFILVLFNDLLQMNCDIELNMRRLPFTLVTIT